MPAIDHGLRAFNVLRGKERYGMIEVQNDRR